MTPAARISSDTWHRLDRAHLLGARLGEETLTDLLVLEMLQFQNSNAFRIYHPTRREESWCGADLLVWIRRNDGRSRFLAIQAKKLYPDGNYKSLNHCAPSGVRQIDLLRDFAHQYHAIPLYLLYNHFDSATPSRYWLLLQTLRYRAAGLHVGPGLEDRRCNSNSPPRTKEVHCNPRRCPVAAVAVCFRL